jgi:hypothetical protein
MGHFTRERCNVTIIAGQTLGISAIKKARKMILSVRIGRIQNILGECVRVGRALKQRLGPSGAKISMNAIAVCQGYGLK